MSEDCPCLEPPAKVTVRTKEGKTEKERSKEERDFSVPARDALDQPLKRRRQGDRQRQRVLSGMSDEVNCRA